MTQDATIYQGEFKVLRCTVWADAAKTIRKSLAGATAEYRVGRKNPDTLDLRVTNSPNAAGSVVSVSDAGNGVIDITLRQGDTSVLPARKYTHQVIVNDSAGKVNVVTDGFLTIGETIPST